MASGTIISWQIDEETVETVSDFMFLGSKITADGDCSHEIKRRLLLGRKVMPILDLLLLPPIPPSIRVFSNESTLLIRWPKYWSFSFSISPSKEHSGLISFRMDWLDLLCSPRDSQESSPTPQFKSINSSVLSFLHSPTLTSIHDHRKNHSLD